MDLLEIHVTADTGGSGIEVRRAEDPAHLQYVTPDELGVSAGLASKLRSWQGWFDGVWELCGADERFAVLGDRFDDIGKQLAEEMAKEAGLEVKILYGPQGGWCLRMGFGKSIVIQDGGARAPSA